MVFFHVQKNGGTTIRNMFLKLDNADTRFRIDGAFSKTLPTMKRWAGGHGDPGKVLIVEIHFGSDLVLAELAISIERLRQRCEENNVPFFVLTAYREPLSYAISYFNYINVYGHHNGKYDKAKPTAEVCGRSLKYSRDLTSLTFSVHRISFEP